MDDKTKLFGLGLFTLGGIIGAGLIWSLSDS